jgi:hypothetical protein
MEKKMKKSRKKEPRDRYFESFELFIHEFKNETDRAAVIVGAAKLDLVMYQILQRFFLPSPRSDDELFEGESQLSTMNAKINILYRLGIIDADFAKALHLVRKIRNDFAHDISGCDLSSGSHRNRVRELFAPFEAYPKVEEAQQLFFKNSTGPSADFRTILAILAAQLEILCSVTKVVSHSTLKLIPERWKKENQDKK